MQDCGSLFPSSERYCALRQYEATSDSGSDGGFMLSLLSVSDPATGPVTVTIPTVVLATLPECVEELSDVADVFTSGSKPCYA